MRKPKTPLSQEDLLCEATMVGNHAEVVALLNAGGNPNSRSRFGHSVLELASCFGFPKIIETLLDWGADCTLAFPPAKKSVLITAASSGETECLRVLLDRGAPVNQTDSSQMTALMHAVLANKPETVYSLIEFGADVTAKDEWGRTAMHIATFMQNVPRNYPSMKIDPELASLYGDRTAIIERLMQAGAA